jgi:hypothetical protein
MSEDRVDEANRRNAERLRRTYGPENRAALKLREEYLRRQALLRMANKGS